MAKTSSKKCKIFYSWQSDLPNATNRGFIQKALETAVKTFPTETEIIPVIDRDIAGVSGSVDIAETIFGKIKKTHIFVCDVSIINPQSKSRKTPNPNVLVELGYALRCLGERQILMLYNTHFGEIDNLPFDIRNNYILSYSMSPEQSERAEERNKVAKVIEAHLKGIIDFIINKSKRHSFYEEENIEHKFYKLADRWYKSVKFITISEQAMRHTACQKIIAMRWKSVKFILEELKREPYIFWFAVLEEIIKTNPVCVENEKQGLKSQAECWLEWGKKQGILE